MNDFDNLNNFYNQLKEDCLFLSLFAINSKHSPESKIVENQLAISFYNLATCANDLIMFGEKDSKTEFYNRLIN